MYMEKDECFHFQIFNSSVSYTFRWICLHSSTLKLTLSLLYLLLQSLTCPSTALFPIYKSYILAVFIGSGKWSVSARKMKEIHIQRKENEFYFLFVSQWMLNYMHKLGGRGRGLRVTSWISIWEGLKACLPVWIQLFCTVPPSGILMANPPSCDHSCNVSGKTGNLT